MANYAFSVANGQLYFISGITLPLSLRGSIVPMGYYLTWQYAISATATTFTWQYSFTWARISLIVNYSQLYLYFFNNSFYILKRDS